MKKNCSCIIPFYNESPRIGYVLSCIIKVKNFDHIILVDDGSYDNSCSVVKKFVDQHKDKNITFISHKKNQWKSYAIKKWFELVDTQYVFLFDADIQNIDTKQIDYFIEQLYNHPDIDMWILKRKLPPYYINPFYKTLLLSWERLLKTKDLSIILQREIQWFQLEVAINTFMYKHKKNVIYSNFSGSNTFKGQKRWHILWWKKDLSMYKDIFQYHGILWYIRHNTSFHPRRIDKYLAKKL